MAKMMRARMLSANVGVYLVWIYEHRVPRTDNANIEIYAYPYMIIGAFSSPGGGGIFGST